MDHSWNVRVMDKNGLLITNSYRQLAIRSETSEKIQEWAKLGSFAPVRQNIYCKWYVDAHGYFEDVALAIENSQEEVFIADWFLSPELQMNRSSTAELDNFWRLDVLLKRTAVGCFINYYFISVN